MISIRKCKITKSFSKNNHRVFRNLIIFGGWYYFLKYGETEITASFTTYGDSPIKKSMSSII